MAFAVYIPVGPDDDEITRVADVLDSAMSYSTQMKWAVLVDDSFVSRNLDTRISLRNPCTLIIVHNPRHGLGDGRLGGMCVSTLLALRLIQKDTYARFVLKLDSDSLVIGPFEDQIERALSLYSNAGIFGVIGDTAAEKRTFNFMIRNRQTFELALQIEAEFSVLSPEHVDILQHWGIREEAQFRGFVQARKVLETATAKGYVTGEYCQGGGYIVTRRMLDAMVAAGHCEAPLDWCELNVAEDVMMGVHCAAVGLRMHDLSGCNDVFTVQGSLPFSPQQLAAMSTSIIHSVKGSKEKEFRTFFKRQRARL